MTGYDERSAPAVPKTSGQDEVPLDACRPRWFAWVAPLRDAVLGGLTDSSNARARGRPQHREPAFILGGKLELKPCSRGRLSDSKIGSKGRPLCGDQSQHRKNSVPH